MVIVVRNFFLFSAYDSLQWYQSDLCVDIFVRLEHMVDVGIDSAFVTI